MSDYNEEVRDQQIYNNLVAEYNNLVNVHNKLVEEKNRVVIEREVCQTAVIASINGAISMAKNVYPMMNVVEDKLEIVEKSFRDVLNEIYVVRKKYNMAKNVSLASTKLTELDDEYQRKFRLYSKFRRICLGYVIGIDNDIVNSETLRTVVEKNYLANSDYWLSHCIMATMLWVHDEQEAATRAINEAMKIDSHKATIFFLLVNLRFGRTEAAKEWYDIYMSNVDINNMTEEWQYLLQAYLYHAFGYDDEFEKKINKDCEDLLEQMKTFTVNYEKRIVDKVLNFANSFVHVTKKEYKLLGKYSKDYDRLIKQITQAEKIIEISKFYLSILESDGEVESKLTRRIESILYNLINAYDEEEFEIIKNVKYNEYIIKAKGDLAEARKMHKFFVEESKPQTLSDLIFHFAFSDLSSNIDNRVRKFSISFFIVHVIIP